MVVGQVIRSINDLDPECASQGGDFCRVGAHKDVPAHFAGSGNRNCTFQYGDSGQESGVFTRDTLGAAPGWDYDYWLRWL